MYVYVSQCVYVYVRFLWLVCVYYVDRVYRRCHELEVVSSYARVCYAVCSSCRYVFSIIRQCYEQYKTNGNTETLRSKCSTVADIDIILLEGLMNVQLHVYLMQIRLYVWFL